MSCVITAELNGVTIDGTAGSDYMLLGDSIEGLGLPEPKTADVDRNDDHGAVAGTDYGQPRVLRVPIVIQREDAAGDPDSEAAMVALRALKAAWKPTGPGDDVLSITIPGIGPADDVLRFFGRPRTGLDVKLGALYAGIIYARATFVALDPIGYGPTETQAGSGTFAVTNPGDATSARAVIEIVGSGGTPVLVNNTDGARDVRFVGGMSGSMFVDLAARTVVDGSGNDLFPGNIDPASLWPRLLPGANSLTLTGATSASVVHRGGWW